MNRKPQYSIYDVLIFVIVVVFISCGYVMVTSSLKASSNDQRRAEMGSSNSGEPISSNLRSSMVRNMKRWANSRYPNARKRVKRRFNNLKRSFVDDTWTGSIY